MKKGVRIILICFSSLLLISWDKASKNLAKVHLQNAAPISYLHDTFRLEYAENTGAAMSIGDALPNKVSF
jgi:signal peptidase II